MVIKLFIFWQVSVGLFVRGYQPGLELVSNISKFYILAVNEKVLQDTLSQPRQIHLPPEL